MATTYQLYDRIKLTDGNDAIIKFIGKTHLNDTLWFGIEHLSLLITPFKPTLITSADIKSDAKSSKPLTLTPSTPKNENNTKSMNKNEYPIITPGDSNSSISDNEDDKSKHINPISRSSTSATIDYEAVIEHVHTKHIPIEHEEKSMEPSFDNNILKKTVSPFHIDESAGPCDEYDTVYKGFNDDPMDEFDECCKGFDSDAGFDSTAEFEIEEDIQNENEPENDALHIKSVEDMKSIFGGSIPLSEGGTCTVSLVSNGNTKYALKEMKKSDKINEELFAKEVQMLQLLNECAGILDYFDAYQTKDNYYLATNYCEGGTLLDPILNGNKFTEQECSQYIYQMLSAVEYMHHKNLVHRDLKLENIMFKTNKYETVKIIDFGDCEIINDEQIYKECVGTLYYLSPEYKRYRKGWELKKSDIWSIGVIAYIMLSGELPFPANTEEETLKVIEKGEFEWPTEVTLSLQCKEFINGLLCKDITKRFNAKDALQHEWICDHNCRVEADNSYPQISVNNSCPQKPQPRILMVE